MYSVCTRIEMIFFNKRGKSLPNSFYKLPRMCHVLLPYSVGWGWEHAGAFGGGTGGLEPVGLMGSCPAGLSWGCHAAGRRWGPLCSKCCASQPVSRAEMDAVSTALAWTTGSFWQCRQLQTSSAGA